MDIKKEIEAKVAQLQDINKQLQEIEKQIGTLQEKGRAIHSQGLQIKGAVDMLLQLQMKEDEALKNSQTAKLILPEGVKPVVNTENTVKDAEIVPEKPVEVLETAEGAIPIETANVEAK